MPACQACGRAFEVRERVGFREECEGCGADLHVCLNCDFHDPGAHNECRESQADPVAEKARANRCEWFRPSSPGRPTTAPKPDPKSALDALFKKKTP